MAVYVKTPSGLLPAATVHGIQGEPGPGDVVGPAGAVAGRVAAYADATGKLLEDGGVALAELVTAELRVKPRKE